MGDLIPIKTYRTSPKEAQADKSAALGRAIAAREEVERFQTRWPPIPDGELVPTFTWAELERQLADLSQDPVKAAMARELVSATRKQATFKPAEMVLREILCLAWALLDEDFQPATSFDPEPP